MVSVGFILVKWQNTSGEGDLGLLQTFDALIVPLVVVPSIINCEN